MTVDPVTQQIMHRTGEMSPVMRHDSAETTHLPEDDAPRSGASSPPRPAMRSDTSSSKPHKSKDHRVSFFSRIIGGKKKDSQEHIPDDASVAETRPEGHDAEVFSPVMRSSDFENPQYQAPNYIRVRTRHSRKRKHFDTLFLAQELMGGTPAASLNGKRRSTFGVPEPETAWAAEFSKDGKYLATAGQDRIVRVWAVITTPEERAAEIRRNSDSPSASVHTAAVFRSKPIREYRGHTSTILDLSWSKNNFLISSSMDKTVRLWHISRPQCLCTFKHTDYVPTICFHPKDDRFFLAGSLDCKLRMWSIPEKHVSFWTQLPNMITAVSFTPEGKAAIVGCADGSCLFYETEGLRYHTQVKVKSAQSKHEKGAKITGIHTFHHPPNTANGDIKVLITSNDSRVRLYNYRDKALEMKMKGSVNTTCQIRASLSDDGRYICCGSEDKRAYIWPLESGDGGDPTKRPVEHFQAHDSMVTCVRFAPSKTRNLLARSSDPIFDICCPPPENCGPKHIRETAGSETSSRNATEAGDSTLALSRQKSDSPTRGHNVRCSHDTGNIVVTASQTGAIKVFRQDCASKQRLRSSNSSKRLSSVQLVRQGSSLRSKQSSHSLQSGRDSLSSTQGTSDRILSWRQDIGSSPSVRTGSISSKHSARSMSPRRSGGFTRSRTGLGDGSRTSSGVSTPSGSASQSPHLSSDLRMTAINPKGAPGPHRTASYPNQRYSQPQPPTSSPRQAQKSKDSNVEDSPTKAEANPLMLIGEQSNLYWNVSAQKHFFERAHRVGEGGDGEEQAKLDVVVPHAPESRRPSPGSEGGLRPTAALQRSQSETSAVSKLSIERTPTPSTASASTSDLQASTRASIDASRDDQPRGRPRDAH
ncbi:hypothetical protein ANO11243_069320 [Dothideomycetidae sp. 11243]|nr:hypothetical protein ANO11243_069320 [fungal sp. No.11243]